MSTRKYDGFEDGDYTSNPAWTEPISDGTATVQTSTVKNGSNTVKLDGSSFNAIILQHDRGTSDSVSDGDIYQAWVRADALDIEQGLYFSLSEEAGAPFGDHAVRLNWFDDIQLSTKDSAGTSTVGSQEVVNQSNLSADTWYRFEIEFDVTNSNVTARVIDTGGTELGSATVNYTGQGSYQYVFLRASGASDSGVAYFDDVSYSTDPETVDTQLIKDSSGQVLQTGSGVIETN